MCVSSARPDWLIESVTQSLATCYNFFYFMSTYLFLCLYCSALRVGVLRYPLLLLKCSCRMKG